MTTAPTPTDLAAAVPLVLPLAASRRARARGLIVVGAVGAALAGWLVTVPLLGIDLRVQPGGGAAQTVEAATVLAVSLTAAVAGWALLALLERSTRRARTTWTVLAAVVLLLSLAGPLTGAVTAAAGFVLAALHLLVGAVLIPGLRRTSRRA